MSFENSPLMNKKAPEVIILQIPKAEPPKEILSLAFQNK
jgi:hypothetical protein